MRQFKYVVVLNHSETQCMRFFFPARTSMLQKMCRETDRVRMRRCACVYVHVRMPVHVCVCLTCKPKASSACGLSKVRNYVTPTAAATTTTDAAAAAADSAAFRVHFMCVCYLSQVPLAFYNSQTAPKQQQQQSLHTHNKFPFNEQLIRQGGEEGKGKAASSMPSSVINSAQLNRQ